MACRSSSLFSCSLWSFVASWTPQVEQVMLSKTPLTRAWLTWRLVNWGLQKKRTPALYNNPLVHWRLLLLLLFLFFLRFLLSLFVL